MNKYFNVLYIIVVFPILMLLTGCNTENSRSDTSNPVNVSAAIITSIQVTPSPVSVAKGQTSQLTATATYSDSTSSDVTSAVTWTPVDTNTATVTSAGLLSGVEVGSTTLTATKDGITSNTVNVNVSAAIITAIQVTPSPVSVAKGQTSQLTATATYSDSTSSDVTSSVTWTPDNTAIATVTSAGLLSGVEVGSTTLTATKDGITSNTVNVNVSAAIITAIQLTPSPVSVAKGQTSQLTATATYSDSTSSDVTSSVTWTPDNTAIATVTSAGLLSGVEVGSTTLTATKDGITSNTVNVDVCSTLASTCIDVFDTGSGTLFTNSPSKAYLDSIASNASTGTYTDSAPYGPPGVFYTFTWDDANALCGIYNNQSLGGRINWRLPEAAELLNLFGDFGNMFAARGWPVSNVYWSATLSLLGYFDVNLFDGITSSALGLSAGNDVYVSCVSYPDS